MENWEIMVKKRQKIVGKGLKYSIFRTKWGYFGLAGRQDGLIRTYLPARAVEGIRAEILRGLPGAREEGDFFRSVQERVAAYFEGSCVDFESDTPIILDGLSVFAREVLAACREVRFGQTESYGGLAERIGRSGCARAVGRVMGKNPLPLIIPCHRVVRRDGGLGGFSAAGGVRLKERLLLHERRYLGEDSLLNVCVRYQQPECLIR